MNLVNAAIISMRTSSKRLPNKSLAQITNQKKSVDIIIERAKLTGFPVIFATSSDQSDDKLAQIAKKHDVNVFRGALLNKIKRWNDCFEHYGITNALLIDGDDLCYDYNIAKRSMNDIQSSKFDIIWCSDEIITGLFTIAITRNAIKKLYSYMPNDNSDTDILHLYRTTGTFVIGSDIIGETTGTTRSLIEMDDQEIVTTPYSDNDSYETEGDGVLDFSELDPWSEGDL